MQIFDAKKKKRNQKSEIRNEKLRLACLNSWLFVSGEELFTDTDGCIVGFAYTVTEYPLFEFFRYRWNLSTLFRSSAVMHFFSANEAIEIY